MSSLLKEEYARNFAAPGNPCCDSDGRKEAGCSPTAGDTGWRFCDSQGCDVVYFSENGDTTFTRSQLKVPVGVKETSGERPLCYCFGHSVAGITEELRLKGRSNALDDIRSKMEDPGCRCEVENPSGSCCLGSVTKGIQIAREELKMGDSNMTTSAKPAEPPARRGEKIARIGTVVSAILASSCCWLPLALLAVGVSGAGIASTLEAYRPLFIVVTFGFLAAAFYFTYRPLKVAEAGPGCCPSDTTEREDCRAPTGKRQFRIISLNKTMLWVVTALAAAFLFFPYYVGTLMGGGGGGGGGDGAMLERMNRVVFEIDGMTCEGCAATVAKAIRGVPGVQTVAVGFERREAVVGTAPCCSAPTEAIIRAVRAVGYRAAVAGSAPASNPIKPAGSTPDDCCVKPPAVRKQAVDDRKIDPERQVVFAVKGLTCPAVKGIGCGHRIAPLLERLDKIEGVETSSANGTGTMIRIVLKSGADREKAVKAVRKDLTTDKRDPTRIADDVLPKALKSEEWRGIDRIGQLTAAEFRKLNIDRVKVFADEEKLDKDVADKLVKSAENEWDRLVLSADGKDGNRPPHRTDWTGRCDQFAGMVVEQVKELLAAEQLDRLRQALACRFKGLPTSGEK